MGEYSFSIGSVFTNNTITNILHAFIFYTCVLGYICACMHVKGQKSPSIPWVLYTLVFWDRVFCLSLAWNTLNRLAWLASEPQDICLSLPPRAAITSSPPGLSFFSFEFWALKLESSFQQTLYQPSHLSGLTIFLQMVPYSSSSTSP